MAEKKKGKELIVYCGGKTHLKGCNKNEMERGRKGNNQDSQIMDFPFEKLYNQLGENDDFLRDIFHVTFDKLLCRDENR